MTNVLLVTIDQLRGDVLSCAGHPLVRTPHLDALAAGGVHFARHYSQAAPCAPGRAALYTGTYQMTNRVVANGTPLDDRFDNVARVARRAGYAPMLFGYTDQSIDPRVVDDSDPRLGTYEGVLPGFDVPDLVAGDPAPHDGWMREWCAWLAGQGYDVPSSWMDALRTEGDRPAEVSSSAFLTGHVLDWVRRQDGPWFAHVSFLRPHPPYNAAGHFATMYSPADVPAPIAPVPEAERTMLHRLAMRIPGIGATDDAEVRDGIAQYYGMISEVDAQVGRLRDELADLGMADDTIVIVTADHGEQAGDHGLWQKLGFFEASFHIPCIVLVPGAAGAGTRVTAFTENVDVLPTLCDLIGLPVPEQCNGASLLPFLDGGLPARWRTAAHWEYDWRDLFLHGLPRPASDPRLETQNVCTLRTDAHAYVQFGYGAWRCFDLAADPTWRTTVDDPAVILPLAQQMLTWRAGNLDRTLTGTILGLGADEWTADATAR